MTARACPTPKPAAARWHRLAPCPACGLAIAVDATGAPVGEHVGSRLCAELAREREEERDG